MKHCKVLGFLRVGNVDEIKYLIEEIEEDGGMTSQQTDYEITDVFSPFEPEVSCVYL